MSRECRFSLLVLPRTKPVYRLSLLWISCSLKSPWKMANCKFLNATRRDNLSSFTETMDDHFRFLIYLDFLPQKKNQKSFMNFEVFWCGYKKINSYTEKELIIAFNLNELMTNSRPHGRSLWRRWRNWREAAIAASWSDHVEKVESKIYKNVKCWSTIFSLRGCSLTFRERRKICARKMLKPAVLCSLKATSLFMTSCNGHFSPLLLHSFRAQLSSTTPLSRASIFV